MARNTKIAAPASDNRASMMTQGSFANPGYPDPSAIEASAVETQSGEMLSMGNLQLPVIDPATGQAQVTQAQPEAQMAQVQPEPGPRPAQPEQPTDPVLARFKAMSPDQLAEAAANLEHLRGRHAEEVGTYRKLFDKFMTDRLPTAPIHPQVAPQPPQPQPVEDESALVTEILTSPKKFMAKIKEEAKAEVFGTLEQSQRQSALLNEYQKHEAVLNSPQFQTWEKQVPPQLIQQATQDPRMLSWLVSQYQGAAPANPMPAQPVAPTPTQPRVVNLGAANGGPSAATRPDTTKPTFARAELARMMLERPDEYRAREEEITLAYIEGRVR